MKSQYGFHTVRKKNLTPSFFCLPAIFALLLRFMKDMSFNADSGMNILFVNSKLSIGKTDSGGAVRTIMMMRALSQVGSVDVISFNEKEECVVEGVSVIYNGLLDSHHSHKASRLGKLLRLLGSKNPYNYYEKDDCKEEVIDSFVNKKSYDVIVVRYYYQACECGLLKYADRLVIDVDDSPRESIRLQAVRAGSWRNRMFIRIQSVLVQKMVDKVSRGIKLSFYSNPDQVKYRNSRYLPNVSPVSGLSGNVDFHKVPKRILFVGGMGYYPNRIGLEHFVQKIFPIIRLKVPDVRFRVVGKFFDLELMNRYNAIAGVECVGFVEDIEREYENCRMVVVPIYQGAGTSIKALEAMKMRRPLVSTPFGMRGFGAYFLPDKDFLLAETDEEFAEKTVDLLIDPEKNHAISDSACLNVTRHFSSERFCEIVKSALSE